MSHFELNIVNIDLEFISHRSLYADRLKGPAQQPPPPSIPYSTAPVPYSTTPVVAGSTVGPCRAKSTQRAASVSAGQKRITPGLYSDLFDALTALKPNTVEAEDVLHSIHKGEHDIWKLHDQEKLSLVYDVFQHHWCELIGECDQYFLSGLILLFYWILNMIIMNDAGNFQRDRAAGRSPRFIVEPKSVGILATASKYYQHFHIIGWPLNTRYPRSAAELQMWRTWDATKYKPKDQPDWHAVETINLLETLVFHLLSAILIGSDDDKGETYLLEFKAFKYSKHYYPYSLFKSWECNMFIW